MNFERITAADVNAGDRITFSRKQEPVEVVSTQDNPNSKWLELRREGAKGTYRIRPGYAVKMWREVS